MRAKSPEHARPNRSAASIRGTATLALLGFLPAMRGQSPEPATALPTAPAVATQSPALAACLAALAHRQHMTSAQLKAEEEQYIGGIVPNFNTVFGGCAPPLATGQKWSLVYHTSVAPFTFATGFIVGGVDELTGSHNGYGWGPAGYFKRAGAEYADTLASTVIGSGALPVLLHQDPRYFQLGSGHPVPRRVLHAALATFICRGDNYRQQFNTSNVVGNLISGAISNAYYPPKERGVALTFEGAAAVTLEGAVAIQLLEFSPELSRLTHRILHTGNRNSGSAAPASP